MTPPSPNIVINSDHGSIIININDTVIARHILRFGYWASEDLLIIKQLLHFLLKSRDTVVFYDVGANIGTHSLALSKTFGDKIKIRAFEAQRQVFNMLCGTLALNAIDNVFTYNLAVSDIDGAYLEIPVPDYYKENNFGGLELTKPERSDNASMNFSHHERVETVTISRFSEKVDFIKLDIEGMEDKALTGAEAVLTKSRPILFVEILKTNIGDLTERLKRHEYIGLRRNADLIAIPLEYQIQINGLERIF